jgi:uncharacterized protein (TIGR03083 family)
MRIEEHIARIGIDGDLLIAAAETAGLDAPVPTCPDWRVRDLLYHLGGVQRWAASFVRDGRTDPADPPQETFFTEPPDDGIGAWFREGNAALVTALRAADPAVACWAFLPAPSPLAFWARRQAHEHAIHRVDVEYAAGDRLTAVPPQFAADGIAEVLECFVAPPRGRRLVADPPVRLGVRTTDTGRAWTVHIGPDSRRTTTRAEPAELVLSGTAPALYLVLWNRAGIEEVRAEGDLAIWELWRRSVQIRWA